MAMTATLLLSVLGFAVGAAAGGMFGAAVGACAGLLVGFPVFAFGWLRAHPRNVVPTTERHSVMCFPYGHAAECAFEGDLNHGRWLDVAWCSLKKARPDCDKGCIQLMNAAGVKPGRKCACAACTEDATA
jgi:hypothetical protein